jgi:hypothetical protein
MEKQEIIKTLEAKNGNRWTKYGKDRIYFDARNALSGLETDRYNTGNISSATLNGESISNSEAKRLITAALDVKIYYDIDTDKFNWNNSGNEKFDAMSRQYVEELRKSIS